MIVLVLNLCYKKLRPEDCRNFFPAFGSVGLVLIKNRY